MRMTVADVVRNILIEEGISIIPKSDLADLIQRIYAGDYAERYKLLLRKKNPSDIDLAGTLQRVQSARVVRSDPDFPHTHFQVFDVVEQPPEAVCCTVDPFVYISHLSAMQLQGLSDRSPTALTLTRPADILWAQMLADKNHESAAQRTRARPKKYRFPGSVRGREVLLHETRHPGKSELFGPQIRVATHGQTFLDMVVRPNWCGGISHVIEIWEREAEGYLDEIINVVGVYDAKLPKVRAGYILNEVMGIIDPRVLDWMAFAQRGSSQKLDPEKPYAPTYSEKWMISINA